MRGVYSLGGEENPLRGKGFSIRREGDILSKSKKADGKNKKQTGKTFAQADIQSVAIAAKTRPIGVKTGLMDIGFWSVFFTSDAMYFTDKPNFIHKHALLIACLLCRRFPVHISLHLDARCLVGLFANVLNNIAI